MYLVADGLRDEAETELERRQDDVEWMFGNWYGSRRLQFVIFFLFWLVLSLSRSCCYNSRYQMIKITQNFKIRVCVLHKILNEVPAQGPVRRAVGAAAMEAGPSLNACETRLWSLDPALRLRTRFTRLTQWLADWGSQ